MGNVIKSATTISNGTIKRNNFVIGVDTSVDYGPTSATTFWNGTIPPSSGYTVYAQKSSGGPSIRVAENDSELITIANQCGGTNITTVYDALSYFNGQSNYLVANIDYPNIVTSGLTLMLDAGYIPSYPRTGTTWNDLSGNVNNGTLVNGPTFDSANGGSIVFDGTNDYATASDNATLKPASFSIDVWFRPTSLSGYRCIITKPFNGPPWGPPYLSYLIRLENGSIIVCGTNTSNTYRSLATNYTFANNTTYNIIFTFNSSTGLAIAYLNGSVLNSTTFTAGAISYSTTPLIIGAGYGASPLGEYFAGNIYTAKIYNTELSATEITQNYNVLKSRFGL